MTPLDFDAIDKKYQQSAEDFKHDNSKLQSIQNDKIKDIEELLQTAVKYTENFEKLAISRHKAAKGYLDTMASTIKNLGKGINEENLKYLLKIQQMLEQHDTFLKKTSIAMAPVLSPFRAYSPNFDGLPGDNDYIKKFGSQRMGSFDTNKKALAIASRVSEYVKRGNDLIKIAKKNHSSANAELEDYASELDEVKKEVNSISGAFNLSFGKPKHSLDELIELNDKEKLSADSLQLQKSRLVNGKTQAKNARGQVKTLKLKIESFKKSFPENHEGRKSALKEFQAVLAKMEDDAKKIEKLESSADKKIIKISKL